MTILGATSIRAKSDSEGARGYQLPASVRMSERTRRVRYECVFSAKGIVDFILGLGRL